MKVNDPTKFSGILITADMLTFLTLLNKRYYLSLSRGNNMEWLSNVLIGLIVLGIIWAILKGVLKFTAKVFSCGLLVLVGIGFLAWILTGKVF